MARHPNQKFSLEDSEILKKQINDMYGHGGIKIFSDMIAVNSRSFYAIINGRLGFVWNFIPDVYNILKVNDKFEDKELKYLIDYVPNVLIEKSENSLISLKRNNGRRLALEKEDVISLKTYFLKKDYHKKITYIADEIGMSKGQFSTAINGTRGSNPHAFFRIYNHFDFDDKLAFFQRYIPKKSFILKVEKEQSIDKRLIDNILINYV